LVQHNAFTGPQSTLVSEFPRLHQNSAPKLHIDHAIIKESIHEAAESLVASLHTDMDSKSLTDHIADSFMKVISKIISCTSQQDQEPKIQKKFSECSNSASKSTTKRSSYKEAIETLKESRMEVDTTQDFPNPARSFSENMEVDAQRTSLIPASNRDDEVELLKRRILDLENFIALHTSNTTGTSHRYSATDDPKNAQSKALHKGATPYSHAADILRREKNSTTDLTPVLTLLADMDAVNSDFSDSADAPSHLYD
jgi:hypothetical protein